MIRFVLLDSGVVGLLCSSPHLAMVASCVAWLSRMGMAGTLMVLPDVTIYETRRELIRLRATVQLVRLDDLCRNLGPTPVTPEAWLKAAEFWAHVRRAGKPTADPHALDGDAILAGVASTIGAPGDSVTIATTNVRHLSWFPGVDARRWETIP
jgi:predicted nucleic acid-binding protein